MKLNGWIAFDKQGAWEAHSERSLLISRFKEELIDWLEDDLMGVQLCSCTITVPDELPTATGVVDSGDANPRPSKE